MGERGVLLLLVIAPLVGSAEDYTEAMTQAAKDAAAGDHAGAARRLEQPAREWPQDFPLQLDRAFYLLRAGQYDDAEGSYRAALALAPDDPNAARGLDAARERRGAPNQAWIGTFGGATLYSHDAAKATVGLAVLSMDLLLADHWALAGLYRVFFWSIPSSGGGMGGPGQGGQLNLDAQQEAHLSFGWSTERWGVKAQLAAIAEALDAAGLVVGHPGAGGALSVHLVAGLEWRVSAAAVRYDDLDSLQAEAEAILEIGRRLALGLGGRAQRVGGRALTAALASVALRGPWQLRLSGETGPQFRLTDVGGQALYDGDDDLRFAARARAEFPVHGPVRGYAGWDYEGWRTPATSGPALDYTAQRFMLGLVFTR